MTTAGALSERIAIDRQHEVPDGYGGFSLTWAEHHVCAAQMIYHRGGEAVEAARLRGQSIYKFRIRSCIAARAITPDMRLRDVRRGEIYNIREVDAISDRDWVYIVAESGVATGKGS